MLFLLYLIIRIFNYIPPPALQPYIACFRIIEGQEYRVNRILPGLTPVIALRLKGQPSFIITGLRKTPRLIEYNDTTTNLLIIFREGGINAFFNIPAHEFFNESVALDYPAVLEDKLNAASDYASCITIIENYLLQQLLYPTTDQLIKASVHTIKQQQGNLSISTLASSLYISQDAFEKRFRKVIGTSPKQFASIVRMQAIIKNTTHIKDFTNLALDAGYFDQSHFNKAFKEFTGLTPSSFFKAPPEW